MRLRNIEQIKNSLIKEINYSQLMSNEHKKVCKTLNYIEFFLVLDSTVTGM